MGSGQSAQPAKRTFKGYDSGAAAREFVNIGTARSNPSERRKPRQRDRGNQDDEHGKDHRRSQRPPDDRSKKMGSVPQLTIHPSHLETRPPLPSVKPAVHDNIPERDTSYPVERSTSSSITKPSVLGSQPSSAVSPPPSFPQQISAQNLRDVKGLTFRSVIKLALELAKEQREKLQKFRKDEKHACMELYEVLGLEHDEYMAPPNELQIALSAYTFPCANMSSLNNVEKLDMKTLEEILGPAELKRRIETVDMEVGPDIKPDSESAAGKVIRRQAVSSEPAKNAVGGKSAFKQIPKTPEQMKRLGQIFHGNILFQNLDSRDLSVIFDALEPESFERGSVIIEQGDDGDSFYVIDEGSCQITIQDSEEEEPRTVGFIGSGDSFGELGLMYGTPRAATVTAVSNVLCWVLDRDTYRGILLNAMLKKRERYMEFLDQIPILQSVDPYEKARIADVLVPVELGPGEVIVREGDSGDTFYFIEQGEVVVSSKANGELCRLKDNEYFGELALMFSQPRLATVKTTKRTHLVALSRKNFTSYLGSIESILRRNMENYTFYLERAAKIDREKAVMSPDMKGDQESE
eukprot:Sspe_Gene.14131::Locus_4880_Transcript_6_10_Confidence_0.240_Length_1918::g.14131::m.14131/K04739/PRKAR; cAMP-dependent protein kinase regulator